MKKIISLALAGAALMSLVACSDASYDDKYADPSKTSTVGVPQVFTAIQAKGNTWMNPVYYRYYTQSTTSGTFSGIIGTNNGKGRFRGASEGYFDTRWQNFYDMLAQYRLLQKNYNELSESEQKANEVFELCGRIMIFAQLHEMLSLWGDVPFTGAGYLWETSDYAAAKTQDVYDDDVTLYNDMLDQLGTINTALSQFSNSTGLNSFARQDISCAAGDINIWRRYCNSLRLRIAVHLASQGDLTSQAQSVIAAMIGNDKEYPMIYDNSQNIGVDGDTQTDTFNYGKSFSQALHTGSYAVPSATFLAEMGIIDGHAVKGYCDPRVEAMLDPNPDGDYVSYSVSATDTENSTMAENKNKEYIERGIVSCNYWAQVDSVALQGKQQYDGNANLNGLWMGAAEVALNIAECYMNGWAKSTDNIGNAYQWYKKGMQLSTEYYVNLKTNSSLYSAGKDDINGYRTYVAPTEDEINAYIDRSWKANQECICIQQWINQFVMNELEAWNITRRTGFPSVWFAEDTQNASYPCPPDRLPYTSNEKNYNADNEAVAETNNYKGETTGYYTALFWAKDTYYSLLKK